MTRQKSMGMALAGFLLLGCGGLAGCGIGRDTCGDLDVLTAAEQELSEWPELESVRLIEDCGRVMEYPAVIFKVTDEVGLTNRLDGSCTKEVANAASVAYRCEVGGAEGNFVVDDGEDGSFDLSG